MPLGKRCKYCDKIIREHTCRRYVPYDEREDKSVKYSEPEYVGTCYTLGFCSDVCKKEYYEKRRLQSNRDAGAKHKIRDYVIKRDEGCIFCNSGYFVNLMDVPRNRLELHRIKPGHSHMFSTSDCGEYTVDNTVCVCWEHHKILSDKANSVINKWNDDGYVSKMFDDRFFKTGVKINDVWVRLKAAMERYILDLKECDWGAYMPCDTCKKQIVGKPVEKVRANEVDDNMMGCGGDVVMHFCSDVCKSVNDILEHSVHYEGDMNSIINHLIKDHGVDIPTLEKVLNSDVFKKVWNIPLFKG